MTKVAATRTQAEPGAALEAAIAAAGDGVDAALLAELLRLVILCVLVVRVVPRVVCCSLLIGTTQN